MRVRFYATLRDVIGTREEELALPAGGTVRTLLDGLVARFPALREHLLSNNGDLARHVHVFVDGRDAPYLSDGLDTRLTGDENVDVFPPVGGG